MGPILRIGDVAKRAGRSYMWAWRYMTRLNNAHGGRILCNARTTGERPYWTVAEDVLRTIHPQWYENLENLHSRLEEHEERLADIERTQEILVASQRDIVTQVKVVKAKVQQCFPWANDDAVPQRLAG